jgi:hypothetical protein
MIYFDLDGVLRLLGSHVLGYEPTNWHDKYNGKTIIEIINENPRLCLTAPETEYLPIVNDKLDKIVLLTNQMTSWIPYTDKWLNNHIKIQYEVIYTKGPEDKLKFLKKSDILVEDFPNFLSYSQIALITRKYNEHLEVPLRISSVEQFKVFLEEHANR